MVRKRPASALEGLDFVVKAIYLVHAVTGKPLRAYLLAKSAKDQNVKKQITQISPLESKTHHQLVVKMKAEEKMRDLGFIKLREWPALRKAQLLTWVP